MYDDVGLCESEIRYQQWLPQDYLCTEYLIVLRLEVTIRWLSGYTTFCPRCYNFQYLAL